MRASFHRVLPTALFILALSVTWSLVQPAYGVSDEPAHVIKALATTKPGVDSFQTRGEFRHYAVRYRLPMTYSQIGSWKCYSDYLDTVPTCSQFLLKDGRDVWISSTAGEYPPLYYALVGWAGWISQGPVGLLLMRLLTGLIVTVLFFAAMLLLDVHEYELGTLAVFLCSTPTVLAFSGSVNPYAPEVAAATLFWASALVSLRKCTAHSLLASCCLFVSAFLFGLFRPGSFVWIGMILFLVTLCSFPPIDGDRNRVTSQGYLLAGGIGLSLSYAWFRLGMPRNYRNLGGAISGVGGSLVSNMRFSFERTDDYLRQIFGYFGWTNFFAPVISPLGFISIVTVIWIRMQPSRHRGKFLALVLMILLMAIGPSFLEGARAAKSGLGFQGRYIIPVIVGIPLVLATLQTEKRTVSSPVFLRATAVLHLVCINHAIRRFFVGLSHGYWWPTTAKWWGLLGSPFTQIWVVLLLLFSARYFMRPLGVDRSAS